MTTDPKSPSVRSGRCARAAAVTGCALLVLTGCAESCPPPQVVVVNNTPPTDSGLPVLLTVMIGVAFAAAALAGVFAWIAARQRSRRLAAEQAQRSAEDTLLVLTDRARSRYDLPGDRGVPLRESHRATAEALRRPTIERANR